MLRFVLCGVLVLAAVGCGPTNLERLATGTANRMDEQDNRIQGIEDKVDGLGGRIGDLESGQEEMQSTLRRIEGVVCDPAQDHPDAENGSFSIQGGYSFESIVRDDIVLRQHQEALDEQRALHTGRVQQVRDVLGISAIEEKIDQISRFQHGSRARDEAIISMLEGLAESFTSTMTFQREAMAALEATGMSIHECHTTLDAFIASIVATEEGRLREIWTDAGYRVEKLTTMMPMDSSAQVIDEVFIPGGHFKLWKNASQNIIYFRYRSYGT